MAVLGRATDAEVRIVAAIPFAAARVSDVAPATFFSIRPMTFRTRSASTLLASGSAARTAAMPIARPVPSSQSLVSLLMAF